MWKIKSYGLLLIFICRMSHSVGGDDLVGIHTEPTSGGSQVDGHHGRKKLRISLGTDDFKDLITTSDVFVDTA